MYHQVFIRRINESDNISQLVAEYNAIQGIIDRETYSGPQDYQDLRAKLEIISSRIQVLEDAELGAGHGGAVNGSAHAGHGGAGHGSAWAGHGGAGHGDRGAGLNADSGGAGALERMDTGGSSRVD